MGTVLGNNGYSAWFVDCDATAECFDDFNPLHPATRVDDLNARRTRLSWLQSSFDPRVRIPLYRAAMGDDVIASHHWSFDSLKLSDVENTRALMEILYMVPPMYHLNRETWPQRRAKILGQVAFWSPLHRQLATAPLTRFEWLTDDRMAQRTTFQTPSGAVTISVNFSERPQAGLAPLSATVGGAIQFAAMFHQQANNQTP